MNGVRRANPEGAASGRFAFDVTDMPCFDPIAALYAHISLGRLRGFRDASKTVGNDLPTCTAPTPSLYTLRIGVGFGPTPVYQFIQWDGPEGASEGQDPIARRED